MSGSEEAVHAGDTHANVVLDAPSRQLDRPFTYRVPHNLEGRVEVGSVVLVPFHNTRQVGYVLEFCEPPDLPRIRDLEHLVEEPPVFDRKTAELCKWMAAYYLSPLSQVIRLVVPPGRSRKVTELIELETDTESAAEEVPARASRQRLVLEELAGAGGSMTTSGLKASLGGCLSSSIISTLEKKGLVSRRFVLERPRASRVKVRMVCLTEAGEEALRSAEDWKEGAPARLRILDALSGRGGAMTSAELHHLAKASSSTVSKAEELGLIRVWEEERLRDPFADRTFPRQEPYPLNPEQQSALREIAEGMDEGKGGVYLLDGITGSGKTEVYLHAIDRALKLGRSALVLVPEIALTPQMVQRFKGRLGEQVAVLHSRLGLGERYDQWRGIREGRYRVVIGARSALFAPLRDLGLLVIDEEHENTYKQGSPPRYHAGEVAAVRARLCGAVLVLGSATPRLESRSMVERGDFVHLVLPSRIDNRPLPRAEVVDMRGFSDGGGLPILSPRLVNALGKVYEAGEQAMLFLNRRGFARFLQCHGCGYIFKCPNCSVSLCFHSRENLLMCHHCGWQLRPPFACPDCGRREHRYAGMGTERVEKELARLLPPLRCIRMDADTTRRKDAHWDMLEDFKSAKAQVLLGTQMIAKGLDIPSVTLVGVVDADTSLGLPDFRAGERTFQLLTQVSGRAGRGRRPGRVIIQTFSPDHYAIEAAVSGDGDAFYRRELEYRREAGYPPFSHLVNLVFSSGEETHARAAASRMAEIITPRVGSQAQVLGPAPAPLSRIKGKYRYHITIKAAELREVSEGLEKSISAYDDFKTSYCRHKGISRDDLQLAVDVDPVTLL